MDVTKSLYEQLCDQFSVANSPVWKDASTTVQCRMLEEAMKGPEVYCKCLLKQAHSLVSVGFSKNHWLTRLRGWLASIEKFGLFEHFPFSDSLVIKSPRFMSNIAQASTRLRQVEMADCTVQYTILELIFMGFKFSWGFIIHKILNF